MKKIKRIFLILLIIGLAAGGIQIKGGYDRYIEIVSDKPISSVVAELQSKDNYTVYDDISDIYLNALVAVEDRRYYKHNGFDIIGTGRAIYNDIKSWKLLEGGSTISQQLAKNLYFPQDNTLQRKIAEIFMAVDMEKQYGKKKILEFYVNAIYYGSGYYSLYDASMGYFDKEPKKMSDYECTLLAGIPNAPSVYSLDVNPDLAHQRQRKVVSCMVECGYLEDDFVLTQQDIGGDNK